MTLDPSKPRFSGKVEIDVRLSRPSALIYLHGRSLTMHSAVAIVDGKTVTGDWRQVDPTGVAALRFAEPLPAGPARLVFEFDGAYGESPVGLFRVKVGDSWYGWSQFESIDARAAFPCFDEPGFKTSFTITLRTPPAQMAVSNSPEISATTEAGLAVHRFAPTQPLPTYLVAMMSGPFAATAGEVAPTPQRAQPLPLRIISSQTNATRLEAALAGTQPIVARLEAYFGDRYPYPKLDQISTPILPGAMENAGADLYADSILLIDGKASAARQIQFGRVVAHELAHQWFGDLVTPSWWSDIWLNESFANWMGYHIASEARPDLKLEAGALAEGFAAMDTDALHAGRPVRQPIIANNQIDDSFDAITYGKGGHVLAMISGYLGEDKFRDGVRRYMARHRFGSATSDDFFSALAEAAGDPRLVDALRGFIDQQGVPLLTFTREGNHVEVSQSRFALLGTKAPDTRWIVPLCVRRGDVQHCELLTDRTAAFEIAGKGAFVPNAGGAGYFRFEQSRAAWDALIAGADTLSDGEAMAVADSLQASFRAGRAPASQIFALARKLLRNPGSRASEAAGRMLDMLSATELIDPRIVPDYRAYLTRLYRPVAKKLGFDPRAGAYATEDPEVAQRRSEAVSRMMSWSRDRAMRHRLLTAARAYFAGDKSALDPQWFDTAFDVTIAEGGLPAAQALGQRALASQDAEFRPVALDSLATSGSVPIAKWLLYDWKDDRLRASEQRRLLAGIMEVRSTRDTGYAWLREHLGEVTSGSEGIFFSSRVPQLIAHFCSIQKAREFDRDLRPLFAGQSGELELSRAIERVRDCGILNQTMILVVTADIGDLR